MWRIFIIFNNDEHSAENGHSKFVFVLEKINTSNNKFCEMMLRKPHTYSTLIAIAQNHYLSFVIIFSSISKLLIWYCSTVIKYWTWTNSTQIKKEKTNQMKKNWNKRKTKKTNIIYCLWLRDHTHRDSSSHTHFMFLFHVKYNIHHTRYIVDILHFPDNLMLPRCQRKSIKTNRLFHNCPGMCECTI